MNGRTTSTQHELDFNDLSSDNFERLVLYLLEEDSDFIHPQRYGGGGDRGRDIVAFKQQGRSKKKWYFQCKRHKEIGASLLNEELEKIHQHSIKDPEFKPDEIVFAISCTVSAKAKDKIEKRAKELGLSKPHFWTKDELAAKVNRYPRVREFFFGIGYSLLPDIFIEQVQRELRKNKARFIPKLYIPRRRAESILRLFVEPIEILKDVVSAFSRAPRIIEETRPPNIRKFDDLLDRCLDIIETKQMPDTPFKIDEIIQLITEETEDLEAHLEEDEWSGIIRESMSTLRSNLSVFSKQTFLILDPAGTGKTNLLCKWAFDSLAQDSPYHLLLLTGNLSISNEFDIVDSLLRSLSHFGAKIPTLPHLLQSLEFFIREEKKPIIIAIDAINENTDSISTNLAIKRFLDDLEDHPQIKVVITCRKDFINRFNFHENRDNLELVEGLLRRFERDELRRGIPLHLEHYHINAQFSESARSALLDPFVLRFFCEAHGDIEAREVKELGLIPDIWLHKLFQKYEENKFKELREKFPAKFSSQRQFKIILKELAGIMLSEETNRLRLDDLQEIVGSIYEEDSLYRRLLDEEIIIEKTSDETEDFVQFSFDLYREYQQAEFLYSVYQRSKVGRFTFLKQLRFKKLFSSNYLSNSEGLLRFLFINLRKRSSINLWKINDAPHVLRGCLEGLAQIENEELQDSDIDFIRATFESEHNTIFDITFRNPLSYDWKLGLYLQDRLLSELSTTKRDLLFGSYVFRNRDDVYWKVVDNLQQLIEEKDTQQNLKTIEVLAKSSIWLLGSNVTGLRYEANLVLLKLGVQKSDWLLNLIKEYWTIDDYYIRERLLSLVYALSIIDPDIAVSCAEQVIAMFLDTSSAHYSTHFMIREFARDIVLEAYGKDSQLLSKSQLERIRRINRPIQKIKRDYTKTRPQENWTGFSNYPIKMDMKIYEFGLMAHYFNKHRCDATDIAIEIIQELGYTEDDFESIDREILEKRWSVPNDNEAPMKIERFGKKYAWQAYRILQGQWIDTLPFVSEEDILSFAYREFDPLIPETNLIDFHLGIDMVGDLPLDQWLEQPPIPIARIVLREHDWVVVGGSIIQNTGENRRVAVGIGSLLVDPSVAQSRIKEIQSGNTLNIDGTIHNSCYNHEIPLCWELKFDGLSWIGDELLVISGRSEFRLGKITARYALRADFIQTMGLTQKPRTMNFADDDANDIIKTQSWNLSPYTSLEHSSERSERGEWILVRADLLKEYLQRKNKVIIVAMIDDRWGGENIDFKRKISHDTLLIQ
ncbi:MAG: restriction endonuclease [Candidatus Thorarchaeota archaeon]